MTLTTEDKQIISLREDGITLRGIANKLSLTYDKVRYVCRREGVGTIKYEKTCLHCGDDFETIRNSAKFCGKRCRSRYNKTINDYGNITRPCKNCNEAFNTYETSNQVYCSTECKKERRELMAKKRKEEYVYVNTYEPVPRILKACVECEETFETTEGADARYCSRVCSTRVSNRKISRRAKERNLSIVRTCGQCGVDFRSKVARKYCTDDCSRRMETTIKERRRRKTIALNGEVDRDITLDKLIVKENNICYLCKKECNKDDYRIREGHYIVGSTYPSIEHVKPISKGGTHTWDNVKLAHHLCNSVKSDKES